jgi:hypothetical protein
MAGNEPIPLPAEQRRTVALARECASRGWPVFPCQPGTKEPATRHGLRDASTDPGRIKTWWKHNPAANLAIATGAPGPDVLDVDQHGPAGNGYAALLRLKHADLLDAAGTIVRTPHGGLHAYFAGSSQGSGRLRRHFKAAGGYVLVPPSQVDGRPYYYARRAEPSSGLSWSAVTRMLEPQPDRPALPAVAVPGDTSRLTAWVERLEEGNRNAGLFWAACRAVESGQHAVLDELAVAAAKTGLTAREIFRTIDSARRAGGRQADREAAR